MATTYQVLRKIPSDNGLDLYEACDTIETTSNERACRTVAEKLFAEAAGVGDWNGDYVAVAVGNFEHVPIEMLTTPRAVIKKPAAAKPKT